MSRLRAQGGQSSVELVAALPLLVAVGLALVAVFAAAGADQAARSAAHAGALAALQDRDPAAAARAALGGRPRRLVDVRVSGGRVVVRVRPRLPLRSLARRLEAQASAHAGGATGVRFVAPARGGDGQSAEAGR